jgi:hypothetical protein
MGKRCFYYLDRKKATWNNTVCVLFHMGISIFSAPPT